MSMCFSGLYSPYIEACSDFEREIAGMFMELPDRKLFPDYFQTITDPISLQEIEVGVVLH